MKAGFALNIERLYGPAIIRVAAKHLLRELAAELGADSHIDAARIKDNVILRGPDTSAGVAALAKSLMEAAGVTRCRKGAVMGLELLFTLPAVTAIDPRQYFEQATLWAEQYFGVPVLSCVIHADEGAVHAHVLLLPLIDGRMGGSDLHGGKAKLAAMQTSFHEAVGAPHGLPKYVPQKRLSAPVRASAMDLARQSLQANAALNDDIIDALLAPHAKDPAPLLLALGITMPTTQAPVKDFVSMMISPCHPEKRSHIGKGNRKPIGKADQRVPAVAFPESSVGKGIAPLPNPAHEQPQQPAQGTQNSLHTSATLADQVAAADTRLRFQEARTLAGDLLKVQEISAPHGGVRKISDTPRGLRKIEDTPQAVHQLDTLAVDHHQPGAGDLASQSAESSAHLDVSSFARISSPTAPTKPTYDVELVDHQADACEPSYTPRPKLSTTDLRIARKFVPTIFVATSTPCANGIRPHKDVSRHGSMCQGGSVSRPPTGVLNFEQTPTAPDGDLLKTEQVDQQAGQADARQRSIVGGEHPGPHWGMAQEAAGDYQRHRDDDQPADAWCADLGEFVRATGPPASRSHQQ